MIENKTKFNKIHPNDSNNNNNFNYPLITILGMVGPFYRWQKLFSFHMKLFIPFQLERIRMYL